MKSSEKLLSLQSCAADNGCPLTLKRITKMNDTGNTHKENHENRQTAMMPKVTADVSTSPDAESVSGVEMPVDDRWLRGMTQARLHGLADQLGSVDAIFVTTGHPATHPLRELRMEDTGAATEEQVRSQLEELQQLVVRLAATRPGLSVKQLRKCAELMQARDWARMALLEDCRPTVINEDAARLRQRVSEIEAKWFVPRMFARHALLQTLRRYARHWRWRDMKGLILRLETYQKAQADLTTQTAMQSDELHLAVRIDKCLDSLNADVHSLMMSELAACISRWLQHFDMLHDWSLWCVRRRGLEKAGLGSAVTFLIDHRLSGRQAADAFVKSVMRRVNLNDTASRPMRTS